MCLAAVPDIRRAAPADLPFIAALCVEHAAYEGVHYERHPAPDALHAALFGDNAHLLCWVVEHEQRVFGYATATREFSTWEAAYFLHMDCLYLRPQLRGLRLGERLLGALATDAVRLGCRGMQWQTPTSNLRAAAFYRRIGARSKDKLRFYLAHAELRSLTLSVPAAIDSAQ